MKKKQVKIDECFVVKEDVEKKGRFKILEKKNLYESLGISLETLKKKKLTTIVVIGSGGKTTTIDTLAREFLALGKKVVITTTTHMYIPKQNGVLYYEPNENEKEALESKDSFYYNNQICYDKETFLKKVDDTLKRDCIVVVGSMKKEMLKESALPKISAIEKTLLTILQEQADILLVEADGSKGFPLKFPNEQEPVWLETMDVIVQCIGLQALYQPVHKVCHRYKLACEHCQIKETDRVTKEMLVCILQEGYMKKQPIKQRSHTSYNIFLTNRKGAMMSKKMAIEIGCFLKENILCDNLAMVQISKEETNQYV